MKRGFLFGIGSFLIIGVIAMLAEASAASGLLRVTSVIIALVFIPLSIKILRAAKLAPPHHSRLHAVAGWLLGFLAIDATLLVGFAVFAFSPSAWNPFAPKDYEECAEGAATTAKSKEALAILIASCNSRFAGRRKPGGGYTYYDSRQYRDFDIAGPNPTSQEWKSIEVEYSIYLEAKREEDKRRMEERRQAAVAQAEFESRRQQAQLELERRKQQTIAEIERRRQAAVSKIEVMASSIECTFAPTTCGIYKLTVKIKNKSSETIAALSFGWAFVSYSLQDATCPNTLPTKRQERITLRPGDTAVLNIDGYDGPSSTPVRYCIKVSDAQIAPLE